MISFKQLKYFDAVVRLGHFGRAAEMCAVTQPALSMQIQNLEASLGTELLERTGRHIIPTRTGREVAVRAARILAEVRDLEDDIKHGAELLSGRLRLGVIPSIAPYLLPPLLPQLRKSHPSMDLHIRETVTAQLLTELLQGDLDLLIMALPYEDMPEEVFVHALFEDRLMLAMPHDMEPSGRTLTPIDLVRSGEMLLLEEGHCMRDQTIAYCRLQQTGNLSTKGASSLTTLIQMVANGLGVTLLPEMGVDVESQNRKIAIRHFEEPQPSREICLAWRKTSPRQEDFYAVADIIAAARKNLS